MSRPHVIAFGDNVVDCYGDRQRMYPGGNCLNHAVFARRFGATSSYAGAVADDAAGRAIRDALIAEGVDVSLLRNLPGQTAYCVIANRGGERHFLGANLGVSIIAPSDADLVAMARADCVHTGRSSHIDAWLPTIAARSRVSYDFATRHEPGPIAQLAPCCWLAAFSGGELSADAAAGLARLARDSGAVWALVTRGEAGALLAGPDGMVEVAAQPVAAVDTLGAGDTFIARVVVGLLRGEAPRDALAGAADAAAQTCLSVGAFGHGVPMAIDMTTMLSIDQIYATTRPVPGPDPAPAPNPV